MTEKISVIVPIYNIEKYIDKCVKSILQQTYQNLEVLLIDDGSTDASGEYCDSCIKKDKRVKVIHQNNHGRSAARNRGIEAASGDYLMFVDGDDWIDAQCVSQLYNVIKKESAQLAVCRYRCIYKEGIEDLSTGKEMVFHDNEPLEFYIRGNGNFQKVNAVWGKLYSKEIIDDVRFVEQKYYEDIMFTTKIYAKCHRMIYIDKAYYNYNIATENSITYLGVNELVFRDEIPIFYEKENFLEQIGRSDLAEEFAFFRYQRIVSYYRECRRMKTVEGKKYAKRLAYIVKNDKKKIREICKKNFVKKVYKIYYFLFLYSPMLAEGYIKGVDCLVRMKK